MCSIITKMELKKKKNSLDVFPPFRKKEINENLDSWKFHEGKCSPTYLNQGEGSRRGLQFDTLLDKCD